jgi:hypothetical protein
MNVADRTDLGWIVCISRVDRVLCAPALERACPAKPATGIEHDHA